MIRRATISFSQYHRVSPLAINSVSRCTREDQLRPRTCRFSTSKTPSPPDQTQTSLTEDGIFTVTMNRPRTLNAWTEPMLRDIQTHLRRASTDDQVRAVILTGSGRYYCAGVNLSGLIKPMHPRKLHAVLQSLNYDLFDMFLSLDKPIIAAVNGPAVGASVTSAALCDAIVAAESATFSTPFAKLGLPPEGCSSVHFPHIMGEEKAHRMIGPEGWIPTANEAMEDLGLVHSVVKPVVADDEEKNHAVLMESCLDLARKWIDEGKSRHIGPPPTGSPMDTKEMLEKYREVNVSESVQLADCVLSAKFLEEQRKFLSSRGKTGPAMMFAALRWTRPLWGLMVPSPGGGGKTK